MELGASHKINHSLPETVCDLGTKQETTDGYRQTGYKAEYGDYNVPRKKTPLNFFQEEFPTLTQIMLP